MEWFMKWEGVEGRPAYSLDELLIAWCADSYQLSVVQVKSVWLIFKILSMRSILNSLTYDHTKVVGEINTLPSETVPDQSMSIPELIDRYVKGLPLTGEKVPVYDGEDDVPDFSKMDLSELEDYRRDVQNELDAYRQRVNDAKVKAEEEKLAKAVQEELKRLKELEAKQKELFPGEATPKP